MISVVNSFLSDLNMEDKFLSEQNQFTVNPKIKWIAAVLKHFESQDLMAVNVNAIFVAHHEMKRRLGNILCPSVHSLCELESLKN